MKAISIFNRRDKFFANAEETVAKIRHNTDCEIHLLDLDDRDKLRAEIDSSVILTNATGVGRSRSKARCCYLTTASCVRT